MVRFCRLRIPMQVARTELYTYAVLAFAHFVTMVTRSVVEYFRFNAYRILPREDEHDVAEGSRRK